MPRARARSRLPLVLVGMSAAAILVVQCSDGGESPSGVGEGRSGRDDVSATEPDGGGVTVAPDTTTVPTLPPTVPPTVPPPPMPTDDSVGPSPTSVLRELAAADVVPGTAYVGVHVSGQLEIAAGFPATSFSQCRVEGAIVTYSPVNLDSCVVTGGVFAYDTGGTINRSLLLGDGQAFRPGTADPADAFELSTPWTVTETIMRIAQGTPPAHVEASQVLGGVGITFRNVVFDSGGPFNNTQTADLNFIGKDLLCEDCWFIGYVGYALYASGPNNVFLRPRFDRNSAFGLIYPNDPGDLPPMVIDGVYTDGTPITSES